MRSGVVQDKSYDFALSVVQVYKFLSQEKREFIISKQLLRAGTSIGANDSSEEELQKLLIN